MRIRNRRQCLTWFTSSDGDRLVASGKPVAAKGDLWLWSNADGHLAVLAESDTEWGDLAHPLGSPT